jgi:hypothetical protein
MEVKKTITSIFMVPTLKIDRELLKSNGFINGYSIDKRRDAQYEGCVYLLFKPENLDKFREFLDGEYERTKAVIDDYDYEDGYVVVVYKLDTKWKKDFGLVREGLYSLTSEKFQASFPKSVKLFKFGMTVEKVSIQHKIFNKTKDLRDYWEERLDVSFTDDMELWDGFIFDNETLDLDKLKQEEVV